eukprot:g12508.t1
MQDTVQAKNEAETLAYQDADLDELKQKTKDLQEKSWKITQQAYQQGASSEQSSESQDRTSSCPFLRVQATEIVAAKAEAKMPTSELSLSWRHSRWLRLV